MNRMQSQVEEFHRVIGVVVGEEPQIRDRLLRARLVHEEAMELVEALGCRVVDGQVVDAPDLKPDLVETIDAMADTIYVVMGTAVSAGVDLEPFFDEVQCTNMLKAGGPVDAGGKRLKPPGWQPPQIAKILEEYAQWKRAIPPAYRGRMPFERGRRFYQVTADAIQPLVESPWWAFSSSSVVWMREADSPVVRVPFPPPTRGTREVTCNAALLSLTEADGLHAKELLNGSDPYDGSQIPRILAQ
jgi:predicted HAD superfamily Cof-like phosphohydrolase